MDIKSLKRRLARIETRIAETEARLPAHSVKPPVMIDLFALEDEREAVVSAIAAAERDADGCPECG